MKHTVMKQYRDFMAVLRYCDRPLALYYSNEKPTEYTGPTGGFWVELERPKDVLKLVSRAPVIRREQKEKFRCMFSFLSGVRKQGTSAVFDYENYGCPGCRFYLGFIDKLPLFNHYLIANGFPALYHGERFAPTPESSRRHMELITGVPAGGKYAIFTPFESIPSDCEPELIIFMANAEVISALAALVRFVTDEAEAVRSPFSSGCGSLITWALKYARRGEEKAVLGIFDPAARVYLHPGEMTLSVPYGLFKKMLSVYKKSFLYTDRIRGGLIKKALPGWPEARKRAGMLEERQRRQF